MGLFSRVVGALAKDPTRLVRALSPSGLKKTSDFLGRERRKAEVSAKLARSEKSFNSSAWSHGDVSVRNYSTYEQYLEHQKSKLPTIKINTTVPVEQKGRTERFRKRFAAIPELKPPSAVLCLAARLGDEVAAMIALGHFAIGIDLNPGSENRFVVSGDFHALQYAAGSIDCVYCNSFDHALSIEKIAAEVARVLKPGGFFIAEIFRGYEEGQVPRDYESMFWPTARCLAEKIAAVSGLTLETVRDPAPDSNPDWPQFILRKG